MNADELPIASPCTADWTTMTLADRGRFCGECRKVVRELAQMSEREARALLATPSTEGLCVRYVHDASGEILFRRDVVPLARLSRKVAATALAIALPLAAAACATTSEPLMGSPPVMGDVAPPMVMMGAPPAVLIEHASDAGAAATDAPTHATTPSALRVIAVERDVQ